MDWRSLALKNIWHNMRRYLGYLLSSGLAVTIFSMFFIFIFNPRANSVASLQLVQVVLIICVFIVAMFAIFFIFYFHSSLIRARNKEFGLLMTLGMTPHQIGRLIFFESICIGMISLGLGLLLGILCSQPFLLATGAILGLQDAIPFTLSVWAIGVTALFFGLVFLLEALFISWRVAQRTPRILILGARTQQQPPRASRFLVILGVLCLGIAYSMALFSSILIVLTAIPVVVLTIIGTFLLFSQIAVRLLGFMRRRPLHGISLLIVARLAHRIKDYSRLLAMITILNAVVLTGMGAVLSSLQAFSQDSAQTHPLDIQLTESVAHPFGITLQQIDATFKEQHFAVQHQIELPLLSGQMNTVAVSIISFSNFEITRRTILQAHPNLSPYIPDVMPLTDQQAHLLSPQSPLGRVSSTFTLGPDHQLHLQIGTSNLTLRADQEHTRILNPAGGAPDLTVVINDQTYARLQKTVTQDNQWRIYAFYFPNQQQTLDAVKILRQQPGASQVHSLSATTSTILGLQTLAVLLFAGCFVSILFLFAAGSALYFRLFTQQDEDRHQFRALARVGLQKGEALRIIRSEFFLLFFLPVLIAMLHSAVATLALILLISSSSISFFVIGPIIWSAWALVCLFYAGCFALYFLVACFNYFKRIRVALV